MDHRSRSSWLVLSLTGAITLACTNSSAPGDADAQPGGAGGGTDHGGMAGTRANPTPDPGQTGGASSAGQGGTDETEPMGGVIGGDGTGGSAGMPTAGAGGIGGQPAAMNCGEALYCNDFEAFDGTLAKLLPLTRSINSGDSLAVDESKAFSGRKSIRIEAKKAGSTALSMSVRDLLPSPKKTAYARMMLWMENTPGNSGHWDIISMSGPAEGGGKTWVPRFSFGGFGDNQAKLLYYANAPMGGLADCSKGGAPAIPLKQWVCVELGVDETAAGDYIVKVDGKHVGGTPFDDTKANSNCCCGSNNNNTWYVPDVVSVKFGWAQFHEQLKPVVFWIDDVAVGEKPIGCPQK